MGSEGNVFTLTEKRLEEMSERLIENSLKRLRQSSSDASSDEDNVVDLIKRMSDEIKEVVQRVETQVNGILEKQSKQEQKLQHIEKQIQDTAKLQTNTDKEINGVKKSIEKEAKNTKQKFTEIEKKLAQMKELFDKTESEKKALKWKCIDNEAKSRRSNLLFFGIPEQSGEKCDAVLSTFFKEKLGLTQPIVIQRAHRLGKPISRNMIGKSANRPRPIIALFLDFQQREAVRTAARSKLSASTPYGVAEDQPLEIRRARKSVAAEVRELRSQNKKVTILYPCRVLCDGQIVREVNVVDFSE